MKIVNGQLFYWNVLTGSSYLQQRAAGRGYINESQILQLNATKTNKNSAAGSEYYDRLIS